MVTFGKSFAALFNASALLLVTACGGGGDSGVATGSSTGYTTSAAVTYTPAAVAGELMTYTVDPTSLSHSYTTTESQYAITGTTGSGTLICQGNGTYSLLGISNNRIVILPNEIMLGAIRHNFGAGIQTVLVLGLSHPVTTHAGVSGPFDFLSRPCVNGTCASA